MQENTKATWLIVPTTTPTIIRKCSKCNKKMEFYCSEKFRVNANSTRVDIWLIYKCTKCDSTWKVAINKGIKPQDLPQELFDKFINNDTKLAWKYAFDRNLLKQNGCTLQYADIDYTVDGATAVDAPMHVHLKSEYFFELKLSLLLAKVLDISVSKLQKHVSAKMITTVPVLDIMKYKIRADLEVYINANRG